MDVEFGVLFLDDGSLAAEVGRVAGDFIAEGLAGQRVVGQGTAISESFAGSQPSCSAA